jgi:hypothetical protein
MARQALRSLSAELPWHTSCACASAVPRYFRAASTSAFFGGELLETAKTSGADLRQMQAAAASDLDDGYKHNQAILENTAKRVGRAIVLLTVEILALVVALVVTLVS